MNWVCREENRNGGADWEEDFRGERERERERGLEIRRLVRTSEREREGPGQQWGTVQEVFVDSDQCSG